MFSEHIRVSVELLPSFAVEGGGLFKKERAPPFSPQNQNEISDLIHTCRYYIQEMGAGVEQILLSYNKNCTSYRA